MLTVTIPAFAFAAGNGNGYNADSATRGIRQANAASVAQGSQLMLQDYVETEDCDCEAEGTGLGLGGEALHLNARVEGGAYLSPGNGSAAQTLGRMSRSASQSFVNCLWTE